jgi:hypothetical protein
MLVHEKLQLVLQQLFRTETRNHQLWNQKRIYFANLFTENYFIRDIRLCVYFRPSGKRKEIFKIFYVIGVSGLFASIWPGFPIYFLIFSLLLPLG